ncbi:MAG: CCA tRNA nucleotidyltransferase [Hellea sp.]|nr:CCA tRNA nucleotidyltransferase [Hellea sp.]
MKLDPKEHNWLSGEDVTAILAALPAESTRFVGGCVRNAILSEKIGDIDLATQIAPEDVQTLLKAAGIKTVPTGINHGTITAIVGGKPFEITTLRKDVETDGRRAVIAYTEDWAEDAMRRDFTINALYADPDGTVFDPSGQGLDDIKSRRFRFVGDANARVREDYLRILRYFRFLAWYAGSDKIDADALKACRDNRDGLRQLSSERIWMELKKFLKAPSPVRAAQIMLTNDILSQVLPEANNVEGLQRITALETAESLERDPILRLMAMAVRDEFALAGLVKRLKFSNQEKARILAWAGNIVPFEAHMEERRLKQFVYASTPQTAYDRLIIRAAGEDDPILKQKWLANARFAKSWEVPVFPLQGRDLKKAGVKDGPEMGRILKALKELWVRSGFEADRDKLLTALALIRKN